MAQKPFKKEVIKRDRLPMNFPHYAIIYPLLSLLLWGYSWRFWVIAVMGILILLVYAARKSVEDTSKDKGNY